MGFGNNEWIEFEGDILNSSTKAINFRSDYWDGPEWIPLSQCEIEKLPDGDMGPRAIVRVKAWLVKKNGWSY